jgi:Tfp pilus assembly protein, pilus retraction ATPase PilT
MNDNTPMFQLTDAQAPESVEAEQSGSGPLSVEDLHVDDFLNIVVDRNASDLHISANCEPVIREDGKLKRLNYQRFHAPDHSADDVRHPLGRAHPPF